MSNIEFTFDYDKVGFFDTVYKFRKNWNNSSHKRTITHQELYFAKPSSFKGDAYDCKLPIQFDAETEEIAKEKMMEVSLRENSFFTEEQHIQNVQKMYKAAPFHDKDTRESILEDFKNKYDAQLGVLSMTLNVTDNRMWRFFGNFGKGFCVGYTPALIFPPNNITFGNVDYFKNGQFPHVSVIHRNFEERMKDVMTNLFSLRAKFRYQEEFRFTKMGLFDEGDRIFTIPIEAHKSIVLGANISKNHKAGILNAKREHLSHIDVFQFERDGKDFICNQIE